MNRKLTIGLSLLFILNGCLQAFAAEHDFRPYTVDDFIRAKWLTTARISPDGAHVLYTINEFDLSSDKVRQSLWVVSATGGIANKLAEVSLSPSPSWSPDSKKIAFSSKRDGGNQLWLSETIGGEPVKLTRGPSDVQKFAWSPDGKSIAFTMTNPISAQALPTSSVAQNPRGGIPQLYLVNVETKETRYLATGELAPNAFSWSPDGAQLAFTAQGDLYALYVDTGQVRKLVERTGKEDNPLWSPDGSRIAFFTNYGQTWGASGLSVVMAQGGTLDDRYRSFDPGFGGYPPWYFGWSADSKTLYSAGFSRMSQHLYAISVDTGKVKQVTSGQMVYHDFSMSEDGRTMAFLASDSTTPTDVYVSPVSHFKPRRVTDTNPQLKGINFGKTEAIRWKSKDGLEIEGLLLKPVGYKAGRRYPLLVLMEGTFGSFDFSFTGRASADAASSFSFPFQQQIFAGQGYAVLMPNPRGSWGYGVTFNHLASGDFGQGPYNDIIAGVDHLIEQGVADPERLGIMGIYVDGYRAAFAITQTNRFKAASIGVPIFDLVSWYGQLGPDATYADRYFGGPPWQVPRNYQAISPVNFAGNIKTPTLLFSVALPDFPAVQQTKEMYTALKRMNVPMEYVVYPPYGDGFATPKSLEDVLRKHSKWFSQWLH